MQVLPASIPSVRMLVGTMRSAAARPALYLAILLFGALAAFGYKLRTDGVFACPASGYGSGSYLAYCQTNSYGDYDHGAFWYGMEPQAQRAAADASVLFVGNSRMQFGFSSEATGKWFSAHMAPYYLLGFSFGENVLFEAPLLERLKPKASVYVINVDRFFDASLTTQPEQLLRAGAADTRSRYEEKQRWQWVHERLCGAIPAICGHEIAFYRSRATGAWQLKGTDNFKTSAIGQATFDAGDQAQVQHDAALAEKFISALPVPRSCVILTLAPWGETPTAAAQALAAALKLDLVSPKLDGLHTFDGDHLDATSAERWSAAFFDAAGPRMGQCVDDAHARQR